MNQPAGQTPLRKVKAPRNPNPPLQPAKLSEVEALLGACNATFLGKRDRAIILSLLDTGVRAAEMCNMQIEDLDRVFGSIFVKRGKGRKPRTVFLGKKPGRLSEHT